MLVIDDSGSMNREHEWLLVMVPSLEQILIDAGKPFVSVGKGGKGGEGEEDVGEDTPLFLVPHTCEGGLSCTHIKCTH